MPYHILYSSTNIHVFVLCMNVDNSIHHLLQSVLYLCTDYFITRQNITQIFLVFIYIVRYAILFSSNVYASKKITKEEKETSKKIHPKKRLDVAPLSMETGTDWNKHELCCRGYFFYYSAPRSSRTSL